MKNCSQWKASVGQAAVICVQPEECDLSLMVAVNRQADPLGFVKSTFSIGILAFTQPQKYLQDVVAVWSLYQRPPCQVHARKYCGSPAVGRVEEIQVRGRVSKGHLVEGKTSAEFSEVQVRLHSWSIRACVYFGVCLQTLIALQQGAKESSDNWHQS